MIHFSNEHALFLKSKLDYRKFYRQYLELKSNGEWMASRCPFHNGSKENFCIHEKTGIWHCKADAGCGSGDVISFYQKITGKSFDEAIIDIANSQDIKIEISEEYRKKLEKKKQIYQLNNFVAKLYMKSLSQNKEAQQYLTSRNFDIDTIKKFKLGYIPGYKLSNIGDGILPFLEYAGLSYKNGDNYFSCRRISIPFMDTQGNIVGFSSRTIDADVKLKYLHTKNNEIFQKSELLFAYNFAKNKIKESRSVFLVEGQIDAIRAHQYGIENCVAMCGLNISEKQLKLLSDVLTFYIVIEDIHGDNAIDMLYEKIFSYKKYATIKIIDLRTDDKKCDLDEFLLEHGLSGFYKKRDESKSYLYTKIIGKTKNARFDTIEQKHNYIYSVSKYFNQIKDGYIRKDYMIELSELLGVEYTEIFRKIEKNTNNNYNPNYNPEKHNRIYGAQLYILATFFANNFKIPQIYDCLKDLKVKNKLQNKFKKIFEKICDTLLTNGNKCDIMNILYSSNILNEDELEILTESFMKHDDLDYLEDKEELEAFLKDQLENLR